MVDEQESTPDWERRRRLAEIFGEVLPASTGDDRDPEDSRRSTAQESEEWLKRQVPPHHGG